ncbi:DUF397 domain-containing protein [Streptomyces sp. NPDC008163]|uniref:DUF397 domain-containing protein n=1 Tax=Streptomyces sp. NPDC008163 TaxID=3364818 RepID=UPI0036E99AD0
MIDKPSTGDVPATSWFKSSFSDSSSGNNCVEVAAAPGAVLVRDSKDVHRPHLAPTPRAWAAFVTYAAHAA